MMMIVRLLIIHFKFFFINKDHWLHDYKDKEVVSTLASRMKIWLRSLDGVNVLLADRSEVGWYAVPERLSKISNEVPFASEIIPEHIHHNWKHTDAYKESKKARGVEAATPGQFTKGFSNSKYW